MKKFISICLIFILLSPLVLAEANYDQMNVVEKNGIITYTSSGDGKVSLDIDGKINHYWSIANNSFINVLNGSISGADLTASKDTSWNFGKETITVPNGTRVVFKNGKIEIFGKQNDTIQLKNNASFASSSNITLGNSSLSIQTGMISGKNFEVGGIKITEGSLSPVKNGYILGKNSITDWKGLRLTNDKDLFLANSFDETKNHENWIFPEELMLRGKGSGFEVLFKEENNWAKIDSKDNFAIKAVRDFEFSLDNRDNQGKIPLFNVKGDFIINENFKSLYTQDGNILINRQGVSFGQSTKDSSTSPIELVVDGQKEKYLVSNFKEIVAGVPNDLDNYNYDFYQGTILPKKVSTSVAYNYPTIESLKNKYNVGFELFGSPNFENTLILRELDDYLSTSPSDMINSIKVINILDEQTFKKAFEDNGGTGDSSILAAFYDKNTGSLNLPSSSDESGLAYLRHEMSHAYQNSFKPQSLKDVEQKLFSSIKKEAILMEELDKLSPGIGGIGLGFKVLAGTATAEEIKRNDELHKKAEENKGRITELHDLFKIENDEVKKLLSSKKQLEAENIIPFEKEWLTVVGGKEVYGQETKVYSGWGQFWNEEVNGLEPSIKIISDTTGRANELLKLYKERELTVDEKNELLKIAQARKEATNVITAKSNLGAPKKGFIRPYSNQEMGEDIATYQEKIYDPSFFKPLLNPNSPNYDVRYQQKLDLLLKYKFITLVEYDAVMKAAGLK